MKGNKSESISLPEWLSNRHKKDILKAVKDNTPILIKGLSGPTGKTFLKETLKKRGALVFEEWECLEVELNEFIEFDS
ncbi:hypothetical protein [Virgibacillus dokdonensis]|uniref:Uncharacterized protein n=1 Tax=Virgibacillus dokdonensis TaxID=302167 RepID=A0A2K9J4H4_9BACI|nr:hypothetical protein [Virgibacillus dokdonensis]AUJ26585.1 hypothetical protein A21D_03551 [Virgibacillus dokdonensis]